MAKEVIGRHVTGIKMATRVCNLIEQVESNKRGHAWQSMTQAHSITEPNYSSSILTSHCLGKLQYGLYQKHHLITLH